MSADIISMPGVSFDQDDWMERGRSDPILALAREYFLEFHCDPAIADRFIEYLEAEGLKIVREEEGG